MAEGAAAHLPTCDGRRVVDLAEPDLVRQGKEGLGGVTGPKGSAQSWPRRTSAETSWTVGEKSSTPTMRSITKEMTLWDTFILSICAERRAAA